MLDQTCSGIAIVNCHKPTTVSWGCNLRQEKTMIFWFFKGNVYSELIGEVSKYCVSSSP